MRDLYRPHAELDSSLIESTVAPVMALGIMVILIFPVLLLCGSSKSTASTVLKPKEETVESIVECVAEICELMEGKISDGIKAVNGSVRGGRTGAIVDVTKNGEHGKLIIFESALAKKKHKEKADRLSNCMPYIHAEGEELVNRHNQFTCCLPRYVYVKEAVSLERQLRESNVQELPFELYNVWRQLGSILSEMHKKLYIRDLHYSNIVKADTGTGRKWTLLEIGNIRSTRKNQLKFDKLDGGPIKQLPPELILADINAREASYTPACDMWKLGVLIYEVIRRKPYWENCDDEAVLRTVMSGLSNLPHERNPLDPTVQSIVAKLLERNPSKRLDADGFVTAIDEAKENLQSTIISEEMDEQRGPIILEP